METAVNSWFYQSITNSDLLGGAMIALGVSVVNMGLSTLAGIFFRYINLRNLKAKIIGHVSLVGFAILTLLLNLVFCFFRDEAMDFLGDSLDQEPDERKLFSKALMKSTRFLTTLALPSISLETFLMFFIGAGCSMIAFYKGYSFDDKYPGHGTLDRKQKKADQVFKEAQKQTRARVEAEIRQHNEPNPGVARRHTQRAAAVQHAQIDRPECTISL
ncbi:MAG: hypothetical protein ACRERV_05260 [Methylococcales bacterium]